MTNGLFLKPQPINEMFNHDQLTFVKLTVSCGWGTPLLTSFDVHNVTANKQDWLLVSLPRIDSFKGETTGNQLNYL